MLIFSLCFSLTTVLDVGYFYACLDIVWSVYLSVCIGQTGEPTKVAELIEMPFWMQSCVGPRNHVLFRVHTGTTWRIQLNNQCLLAMQAVATITVTTCLFCWVVGCWHGYLSGARCSFAYRPLAQLMPLPVFISCSSKSRLVLPERFCFSGTGLPRLSWKKGH